MRASIEATDAINAIDAISKVFSFGTVMHHQISNFFIVATTHSCKSSDGKEYFMHITQ